MLRLVFFVILFGLANHFSALQAAPRHVVFIIAEDEYKASESLPKFAQEQLTKLPGFQSTFLKQDRQNKHNIPGMDILREADLVVLYVRRRSLPNAQMQRFKNYLDQGKPLLALRTSSHAWDTRNKGLKNQVEWKTFDPDVLGGNYHGHHGKGTETTISIIPGMSSHPILSGVEADRLIGKGSLYKASPLKPSAQVILTGTIPDQPPEPILWFHQYGKSQVVYTSLGHVGDFAQPAFNRLLLNTIRYLTKD